MQVWNIQFSSLVYIVWRCFIHELDANVFPCLTDTDMYTKSDFVLFWYLFLICCVNDLQNVWKARTVPSGEIEDASLATLNTTADVIEAEGAKDIPGAIKSEIGSLRSATAAKTDFVSPVTNADFDAKERFGAREVHPKASAGHRPLPYDRIWLRSQSWQCQGPLNEADLARRLQLANDTSDVIDPADVTETVPAKGHPKRSEVEDVESECEDVSCRRKYQLPTIVLPPPSPSLTAVKVEIRELGGKTSFSRASPLSSSFPSPSSGVVQLAESRSAEAVAGYEFSVYRGLTRR